MKKIFIIGLIAGSIMAICYGVVFLISTRMNDSYAAAFASSFARYINEKKNPPKTWHQFADWEAQVNGKNPSSIAKDLDRKLKIESSPYLREKWIILVNENEKLETRINLMIDKRIEDTKIRIGLGEAEP